ncbi:uncharacterized protein LOC110030002 [Phalaenopsis equestris]|uniref:uncharacterized protein LOC110030002 n=1 Tax=Phalaenopsis equestris TaxID=78828 RepID=UPI0009E2894D|nr:uncharacterized protein LOC110030002 [Phalaenopsis equestris]
MKTQLINFDPGESSDRFIELLIKFLWTNLLFPSSNFRVSKQLTSICEDVEAFSSYNWPATVCGFLIDQLNLCAVKLRTDQPLGYITGFVFLLTLWFYEHTSLVVPAVPEARPRMIRWPVNVRWNAIQIQLAFNMLSPAEVN